ncbi:hypothetical protein KJ359_007309 [Pestalotiopsis sp. 9143b]|nr:hypothetical protein KJ359_007309 [Pestalotiopsis sp. 9143b]
MFRKLMQHVVHPVVVVSSLQLPPMPLQVTRKYYLPANNGKEAAAGGQDLDFESNGAQQNIKAEEDLDFESHFKTRHTDGHQRDVKAEKGAKQQDGKVDKAARQKNHQPSARGPRDIEAEEAAKQQYIDNLDVLDPTVPDSLKPVPRAMTVGSFTSLGVEPVPRVIFNVNLPSKTWNAIKSSRRFNIHVLADNTHGARLAQHYSRGRSRIGHVPNGPANLLRIKYFDRLIRGIMVHGANTWKDEWNMWRQRKSRSPDMNVWAPLSRKAIPRFESDGVLYTLRCVVKSSENTFAVGQYGHGLIKLDETTGIVIGTVQDVVYGALDKETTPEKEGSPEVRGGLTYSARQFLQRGQPIDMFAHKRKSRHEPKDTKETPLMPEEEFFKWFDDENPDNLDTRPIFYSE